MPSGSNFLLTSLALATRMVQTSGFVSARQDDDALLTTPITPESDALRGRSGDQLAPGADGTLTIHVSHAKPTDPTQLANWLPAPDDFFMLQARLYEPEESIVNGEFKLPEMDRVE